MGLEIMTLAKGAIEASEVGGTRSILEDHGQTGCKLSSRSKMPKRD
jgi:hypothetical protein